MLMTLGVGSTVHEYMEHLLSDGREDSPFVLQLIRLMLITDIRQR